MAIKRIEQIPQSAHDFTRRDRIKADLDAAIKQGIDVFEFDGYGNDRYLAQYAREEAENITQCLVRKATHDERKRISEKYPRRYIGSGYIRMQEYRSTPYIRITSHRDKGSEKAGGDKCFRVYGEIMPENLDKIIENELKKLHDREQELDVTDINVGRRDE